MTHMISGESHIVNVRGEWDMIDDDDGRGVAIVCTGCDDDDPDDIPAPWLSLDRFKTQFWALGDGEELFIDNTQGKAVETRFVHLVKVFEHFKTPGQCFLNFDCFSQT